MIFIAKFTTEIIKLRSYIEDIFSTLELDSKYDVKNILEELSEKKRSPILESRWILL